MVWEYKFIFVTTETQDEEDYEKRLHESVHLLNDLGSDGWELIGLLPHKMAGNLVKHHAILKRAKGSTPP